MDDAEKESEEWYILEGMKATVGQDDWFKLPDAKTSRESSINTQSLSGVEIGIPLDTQSSETITAQNVLDETHINQTGRTAPHRDFSDLDTRNISTGRLNLQESIDGVKSNSRHNSSNVSSMISLATNVSMNDTNSLLREAHQSNWSSVGHSADTDGLEWFNLTGSNIQDINRPEPLGFAKNDSDIIGSTVGSTRLQSSMPLHVSNDVAAILEGVKGRENDEYNLPELSTSSSTLSLCEPEKQPINPKITSLLENDTNFSSLASSLTMPSYKELSPKQHGANDKPISKLLGPSYEDTERFLKNLKYANVKYGIKDGSDSEDSHTPQVFSDNNHNYSEINPDTDGEKLRVAGRNVLMEQDIASASLLESTKEVVRQANVNTVDLQSESSDAKRDSEEEMTLSELTVDLTQRRTMSTSSYTSTQASSLSSRTRMPLQPIKETVFSPEHKPVQTDSVKSTSVATSDNTYHHSSISGDANSTSTPYNVVDTSNNGFRRINHGIYDVRDSTSPGSSNRKRIFAGRQPRRKVNEDHDPFTVYVSEDSKLADSMISSTDAKKEYGTFGSRDSRYEKKTRGLQSHTKPKNTSHSEATRVSTVTRHGVVSDTENTDELVQSSSTFLSEATTDTASSSKPNERIMSGIIRSKDDRTKYLIPSKPTITNLEHSGDSLKVVRKQQEGNKRTADHSPSEQFHVKLASNREPDATSKKTNLNELWQDFDESFKQVSVNESPLLRKMELLSAILKKQMEKRQSKFQLNISSDSSDTSGSTCKDVKSFIKEELSRPTKKKKENLNVANPNFSDTSSSEEILKTYRVGTPTSNMQSDLTSKQRICPFCKKRNVGTNCPTPCASDSEYDRPLMLHTWTQTTSDDNKYVGHHFTKAADTIDQRRRDNFREDFVERKLLDQKDVDRNSNSPRKRWERSPESIEKNHRLLMQDGKENLYGDHSQWWTSSNSTVHEASKSNSLFTTKSSSREVACTAWFQTASSDVSEVIPLSKVPTLNERYKIEQTKKMKRNERMRPTEVMTLQEAFQLHKQTFIVRLKQRVQEVRNTRLAEKHHCNPNDRLKAQTQPIIKPQKNLQELAKPINKRKERRPRKLIYENSPREIHRHEAEKQALLRENRLRMKQYDCKIRQSFLRRKKNGHRHNFYVERH